MMFVIMAYDIAEKRVAKVRKIAQKYLSPVQQSVFQGFLSQKQLYKIQQELKSKIDPETDKIVFYEANDISTLKIDEIGFVDDQTMIL